MHAKTQADTASRTWGGPLRSAIGVVALALALVGAQAQPAAAQYSDSIYPCTWDGNERDIDGDCDGLSNWAEKNVTRTYTWKWDTDGDRCGDGDEVEAGTDPRNRYSHACH